MESERMSLLTEQEIRDALYLGVMDEKLILTDVRVREILDIAQTIESAVIEKIKAQGPAARTVASVTNTGYIYIEALERTIPFKTNLYRLPEGDTYNKT